jgi:hypothetical protein
MDMDIPKTLLQAARYFADWDICEEFMRIVAAGALG